MRTLMKRRTPPFVLEFILGFALGFLGALLAPGRRVAEPKPATAARMRPSDVPVSRAA